MILQTSIGQINSLKVPLDIRSRHAAKRRSEVRALKSFKVTLKTPNGVQTVSGDTCILVSGDTCLLDAAEVSGTVGANSAWDTRWTACDMSV